VCKTAKKLSRSTIMGDVNGSNGCINNSEGNVGEQGPRNNIIYHSASYETTPLLSVVQGETGSSGLNYNNASKKYDSSGKYVQVPKYPSNKSYFTGANPKTAINVMLLTVIFQSVGFTLVLPSMYLYMKSVSVPPLSFIQLCCLAKYCGDNQNIPHALYSFFISLISLTVIRLGVKILFMVGLLPYIKTVFKCYFYFNLIFFVDIV
jgi:hypothetical protein